MRTAPRDSCARPSPTSNTCTSEHPSCSTSRPATRSEGDVRWPEPCEGWGSTWASSRTTTPGAVTTATPRGRATTTTTTTVTTASTTAATTVTHPPTAMTAPTVPTPATSVTADTAT